MALDDIVVTDVDSAETITATLTLADINAGSLTTSGTATYAAGTGIWTLTDTVANVNAALANVAFMPATEYDQDTTIAVNIADGGEDGTVVVTGTINLDVTPVNDQPGATVVNQTQFYTEGDVSVALDDIVVTDVDSAETITATLTLADINAGSLTTSGTASYTPGTGVWTITDTVANVNAALANVAFMPATEYDQDTTIAVNIADGGEDATVAVTGTINLDVTPVNDQLAATNVNQTHAYTEDAAAVALDDIVITDIDTGEIVTAILKQSDARAGSLTTSGTATYDFGTGVWTITDTVAKVNAALASVEFAPAADYDSDTTLAVTVMDGGEDGRVAVTGTINLDVTAINDAPIANPGGPYSVIEGTTTTLNGAASGDVDSGGVRYEWDLDYDGTSFNVDATGFSPTFDASGIDGPDSRTVALRVTDDATDLTLTKGSTWAATAGRTAEGFDEVWFARARNFASGGGFELGVGTEPPVAFPDSADHAWSGSGSVDTVTVSYVAGTNKASITVGGTTAEFAVGGQFTDLYIQVRATGLANAIAVSNVTLDIGSGDVLNGTAGTVSAVGAAGTDVHYIGVHNLDAYLSDGFTFSADVLPTFGGGLSAEQIALDVIVANDSGFAPSGGARSAIVTTTVDVTDTAVRAPTPAGEPAPDPEPDPDPEPPSDEDAAAAESFASESSSDPTGNEPDPEIESPASEEGATGGEDAPDDSGPEVAEQAAIFAGALPSAIDLDELTAVALQAPTPIEALMIAADNERTTSLPAAFTERMFFSFSAGLLPGEPMVSADLSYLSQYGSEDDRAQLIGALVTDTGFLDELDLAREDINEVASINHAFVGSTVALSTGISVGYVVWLARGGLLLASMLSSMPAWRLVEPLPILASLREQDTEDAGDSLASLLEQAATDKAPAQDADAPVFAPIVETDLNGPPDQEI